MNNVLVVADETVVSTNLTEEIYTLSQQGPTTVQIVMPRSASIDETAAFASRVAWDRANKNLWAGINAISKLGIAVTGQMGPSDPMAAVQMVADRQPIDTILVTTLPLGASRWLAMDLPHRVGRRFPNCDVRHVVGHPDIDLCDVVTPGETVNVLLVEDNEIDTELAVAALEQGGFDVAITHVSDGAQAVDYLKSASSAPHLVLLDLKMPVLGGHDFLRRLRSELGIDALNQLFVAVVSSSPAQKDRAEAHALGARAYVVKSPDFNVFSDSLNSIVSELAFGWSPPQGKLGELAGQQVRVHSG